MKNLTYLSLLTLTVFVFGACSNESKVKSLALESAESKFTIDLKKEAADMVEGKDVLRTNYVAAVMGKTEFEVESVSVTGSTATAEVKVKTVPLMVRQNVLMIINKLGPGKEKDFRFNASDAISLTAQRMQLKPDARTEQTYKMIFQKGDSWFLKE